LIAAICQYFVSIYWEIVNRNVVKILNYRNIYWIGWRPQTRQMFFRKSTETRNQCLLRVIESIIETILFITIRRVV
jgi:hypothetical protein